MDFDKKKKVLRPREGYESVCITGLGKSKDEIISEIASNRKSSYIAVTFDLVPGRWLFITRDTTWGDVYTYLDLVFPKRVYSLEFPEKLTALIKEKAAKSGKTENEIIAEALEKFVVKN
ncbi:MAG TPA: hypothetical protein PLI45_00405 [Candidatus Woesebacteria bacterium]|nr:hypothetical protein [Candidatus Woesebacteria bacterium]